MYAPPSNGDDEQCLTKDNKVGELNPKDCLWGGLPYVSREDTNRSIIEPTDVGSHRDFTHGQD